MKKYVIMLRWANATNPLDHYTNDFDYALTLAKTAVSDYGAQYANVLDGESGEVLYFCQEKRQMVEYYAERI